MSTETLVLNPDQQFALRQITEAAERGNAYTPSYQSLVWASDELVSYGLAVGSAADRVPYELCEPKRLIKLLGMHDSGEAFNVELTHFPNRSVAVMDDHAVAWFTGVPVDEILVGDTYEVKL